MKELPKAFNPADHERNLYEMWEESGAFSPVSNFDIRASNFSIIMPPPNANGELHIGHAVFVSLEDLMTRYHRMQGHPTLWLPGADHAGFETQVVFERKLEKEGKSRFQFSRDDLYQMMWDFTQQNKKIMESQLRRLGASCDWTREKFTLDQEIVEIVYTTFKKLHDDGLAYRGLGIVNWCPKHQTSLSDLEVKYVEQNDPLYYFKYGPFTIATARPETKFGDKYVVVHPKDRRYKKYHDGQIFKVDWITGKVKATLIKDEAIDMAFGSGAMTVTPAHDPADFEIAKRHKLDIEPIIGFDGRLKRKAGLMAGMKAKQARQEVVRVLQDKKLIKKIDKKYQHNVAVCYKCNTPIEPQVLTQWFINMKSKVKGKSLQQLGLEAVDKNQVIFTNKRFEKIYRHWLKNIRDWNVSRQIVWGIPINSWYCKVCKNTQVEVPKTVTLLAVRHGQSQHNARDIISGDPSIPYHLTAHGKTQAKALAEQLKAEPLDAIIASEFLRTKETAMQIAKFHKHKVIIDKRINDVRTGELEGRSSTAIRNLVKGWTVSVEGSETLAEIEKRVLGFLTDVASHYHDKTVAMVSSEIVLHVMQRLLWGLSDWQADDDYFENAEVRRFKVTIPLRCKQCGGLLKRDLDVFDTWFSSGQWPFATLQSRSNAKVKSQNAKSDFKRFYPTSVMETGHDILFFWVARMIMLGKYITGKVPFKYVYLHGLVRDKDRQKMSKSKGNVIDPLGVIDLYGTDALRMALIFGVAGGNDIVISEEKIRGMRNFANKMWNMARFILINRESKVQSAKSKIEKELSKELDQLVKKVTQDIDQFRFHQAAEKLYSFVWHRFGDVYVEAAKRGEISFNFLLFTFNLQLRLLHPFMPFVSEAIWQNLREHKLVEEEMLINARWPR